MGVYQRNVLAKGIKVGDNAKVYNCMFDNVWLSGTNIDGYNLIFQRGAYGLTYPSTGTFDILTIKDCEYGIYGWQSNAFDVKNVRMKGNIKDLRIGVQYGYNYYATNTEADWTIEYLSTGTGTLWRRYEFDLTITYPNMQTYTTLLNITQKTDWTITLTPESTTYFPSFAFFFIMCIVALTFWQIGKG